MVKLSKYKGLREISDYKKEKLFMRILPNRTTSLFGNMPYIYQKKVNKWSSKKITEKTKFLIVDDKDGQLGMCPLRRNIPIVVYEPDKVFLDGGKTEVPLNIPNTSEFIFAKRNILGFKDRVTTEMLMTKCNLINKNYYNFTDEDKYEYVAACHSIDRDSNIEFSMEYKINKLKSNVADNGYLYLEYNIALKEDDYETYPANLYLRNNEILKYFDTNEWTIITNEIAILKSEYTPLNKNRKDVIVGFLDVKKTPTPKKKEIKHKQNYTFYDTKKEKIVNHSYVINGVLR